MYWTVDLLGWNLSRFIFLNIASLQIMQREAFVGASSQNCIPGCHGGLSKIIGSGSAAGSSTGGGAASTGAATSTSGIGTASSATGNNSSISASDPSFSGSGEYPLESSALASALDDSEYELEALCTSSGSAASPSSSD